MDHQEKELNSPSAPATALVWSLSAALLGMALHLTDGLYSPVGLAVLTLSLVLCIVAALWAPSPAARISGKMFDLFLAGLVAVQLFSMLFAPAGATDATVPKVPPLPFQIGVASAAAGLAILLFAQKPRAFQIGFVLMLASFAGMGIWKIRTAPEPFIDVFVFHRDAAAALAKGINPYTITFPNIYSADTYVYGPGVVRDGRLLFGYPYPPLVLICTSLAQWILGDPRYAMLISMLLAATMIALIGKNRTSMLIAMLLLFTPRTLYLLELAWTEPITVMLLTTAAWAAIQAPKKRWIFAIALGLMLVSKQYLPAAALLIPLLMTRRDEIPLLIRQLLIAGIVGAIVTLPLALWDFHAFWQSAITLQMRQPYRPDSLGYLAWWGYGIKGWVGPFWLAFAMLFLAVGASYLRIRRGIGGFIASFALTYFAFFAFNKQAFANYYYLVLGALCCAAVISSCPRNETKFFSCPLSLLE